MVEQQAGVYLPILEEVSEAVWQAIRDGQPVILTHDGRPAAVVIDLDSYEICEWMATADE